MAGQTRAAKRSGSTEKISVSVERTDLAVLRRRARRLYGGNLSAVVAEAARRIREEEGRAALVDWLGPAGEASVEERDTVRSQWKRADSPRGRGRGRV
jgi:hypothetical protein